MYRGLLGVLRPDRVSAGLQLFHFLRPSHLTEQGGVVLQARGHFRALRSQGLFPDRQRSLVERLGLGVFALGNTGTFITMIYLIATPLGNLFDSI